MTTLSISHIQPGSPPWVHAAVVSMLILHIGAGSIAMLSGVAALSVRKGGRLHRVFGTVFFVSMLTMAAMAGVLSVWIQQWNNVIAGVFAFYLVATAWATVRRKESTVGKFEVGAMIAAFAGAAGILILGLQALADPKSIPGGAPVQAYFILAGMIGFAAVMDLRVVRRGGISGVQRITRHLWRMCLAFFFAWGSFYGQVIVRKGYIPASLHHSPLLYIPILVPLLVLVFWVIRVRFTHWSRSNPISATPGSRRTARVPSP